MVLSRIISIFLLLVVGFVARKRKILDSSSIRAITNFVLFISIPFTIIASFDRSVPFSAAADLLKVALLAIAIHALSILISKIVFAKMPDSKRKILTYTTVFSNCGFMGFPVAESLFGKTGLMYASIYVMVFNVFVWTYGIALISKGSAEDRGPSRIKDIVFNPGNIAVLVGFIVWILPFALPESINYAVSLISASTTPLSMIVVGSTLAGLSFKGLFADGAAWVGSAMRLLIMPLIFFAIMKIIGLNDEATRVTNFLVAMPAAAQTVIFAERYDADVSLASSIVFLTTVLSALTIPLAAPIIGR